VVLRHTSVAVIALTSRLNPADRGGYYPFYGLSL
jgi:hypothetical protein